MPKIKSEMNWNIACISMNPFFKNLTFQLIFFTILVLFTLENILASNLNKIIVIIIVGWNHINIRKGFIFLKSSVVFWIS